MDSLIDVDYMNDRPIVFGRELHKRLGIKDNYSSWFKSMCEYGYDEHTDYERCPRNRNNNNGCKFLGETDHQLTVDMAMEICVIQRSKAGREIRENLLAVKEQWNAMEMVLARALLLANRENEALKKAVSSQAKQIVMLKAVYRDGILGFFKSIFAPLSV